MIFTLNILSASFQTDTKEFVLNNVNKNIATINVGNLSVGQSGVIIHKYKSHKSFIIANATVQLTTNDKSTLLLSKSNSLVQDALPTSNLKPQVGDIFVLNHMYSSSLLIVPNYETLQEIQNLYPKQNFLNPDIFAAHLKLNQIPTPTKKDIQEFCKSYDIGTIFVSINNQLFILDVNSLKTLDKIKLNTSTKKTQSPFFTKIKDIKNGLFNFKDGVIKDYNKYYKNTFGLY
jgi:hypothetical protein